MIISHDKNCLVRKFHLVTPNLSVFLALVAIVTAGILGTEYFSNYSLGLSNGFILNDTNRNNDIIQGEPFYSENTKSTNIKVTTIDPIPTVEVTYTGNSTIDGASTQTIGTIVDKMNTDGSVASKGQAIILTASGQVITYNSESIGTYNPDGSFSDSGVMVFHLPFKMNSANSTSSSSSNSTETDPLAQYDNLFGIYKKTVDPEGNGLTKVWKWR